MNYNKIYILLIIIFILQLISGVAIVSASPKPIATDSRIKTYVYNENEVFRLVIHYGYQTSLELGSDEVVNTISVGNQYAWQISPVGKRIFIKPLEDNVLTNMDIITNKRVYHFEIQSKALSNTVDEELVYVVRFFYPDGDFDIPKPNLLEQNKTINVSNSTLPPIAEVPNPITPYNFNYTLSGADEIAPTKVFDDGINTFFQFPPSRNKLPEFYAKKKGKIQLLKPRQRGDYVVVNMLSPTFELRKDGKSVIVYIEAITK